MVVQDVRGRNASEGEWLPNYHEVEDGDDTLEPGSPPSHGAADASVWWRVCIGLCTVGGRLPAATAHLKALISVVCAGSSFVDLAPPGWVFHLGHAGLGLCGVQKTFHPELMERDDWEKVLNIRPLTDLPKALGYDVPFITRWLEPSDYNDFWRMSNWQERSVGGRSRR